MFKNSEEQSKENFCKEMNQSSAKNTFSYTLTLKPQSPTAKSELTEELVAKTRFIFQYSTNLENQHFKTVR